MADIDVGMSGFGGSVRAKVAAVPPTGWFVMVLLGVVAVLAYHFWAVNDEDTSNWLDPEQPPLNLPEIHGDLSKLIPCIDLARARRHPGVVPGDL